MKPEQRIRGVILVKDVDHDIINEFNAPIVIMQNQGSANARIKINGGEDLILAPSPSAYEPLIPITGTISTVSDNVIVFA